MTIRFHLMDVHARLLAPHKRWHFALKVDIVVGLRARLITREEAKAAHALTDADLDDWEARFASSGPDGLRAAPRRIRRPRQQAMAA